MHLTILRDCPSFRDVTPPNTDEHPRPELIFIFILSEI